MWSVTTEACGGSFLSKLYAFPAHMRDPNSFTMGQCQRKHLFPILLRLALSPVLQITHQPGIYINDFCFLLRQSLSHSLSLGSNSLYSSGYFEILIFLTPPLQCWDYRCALPHLITHCWRFNPGLCTC